LAIGESAGTPKKPDPKMVEKALSLLGVRADEALYVGDSDVDILTAKNAGLDCVSCTWGFRPRNFLLTEREKILGKADPRMMIDSPSELFSVME
ncbi:MAG: HAD family hydrolase, partial [Eubacteriales bacterium]